MKRLNRILFLSVLSILCTLAFSCKQATNEIYLDGEWAFALDPEGIGEEQEWYKTELNETVVLPGSLQEQGKGFDIDVNTPWTGQIIDTSYFHEPQYAPYREKGNIKVPFWLNPDKHYVGAAWYQKKIVIPNEWENRTVILELERPHWTTTLFVDGKKTGSNNSLQTPHRYILNELNPGEHTLTLRVDNSLYVNVGINAHSVSDHTQTNWNGIVGDIKLSAKPVSYIESVQIYPDIKNKSAHVNIHLNGDTEPNRAKIILQAQTWAGQPVGSPVETTVTGNEATATVTLGEEAALWSEYDPNVYKMAVTLQTATGEDKSYYDFGLREFKANGTRFEINGHPIFLRGTLESCIFPLTGYPSMQQEYWEKIYRTCKEYGLNHLRFHSWCPPEIAFHVADSMGFYLQVECGAWAEVGSGKPQDKWIKEESDRILKEYGNHPSFCMMTYGNEPSGKNYTQYLSELVDYWKSKDSRRVYSGAAGWPYLENADYWNTPDPRIQAWGAETNSIINKEPPRTNYDFASIIRPDMPTVSHEIGQWCVYPNFKEIPKYTGVLKAKNLEIFQETLTKHGLGKMAEKFLYASGRLQTLCYKADIEAALRTPGFAGFQLLDLHDFPGQGSALVGVLDPFWESKGYVTSEEYRMFCNSTVPLIRFPKMVWLNNEILEAPIEMAHFGKDEIAHANIHWEITAKDTRNPIAEGTFCRNLPIGNCIPVGNIQYDLSRIEKPTQLTVSVQLENSDFQNKWNIWVYPAIKPEIENKPYIATRLDPKACDILDKGGSVLLLTYNPASAKEKRNPTVGFSSIFWNTAWSRKQAPHTLGVCCDASHPALAAFPNEGVSDYQWWDLMSRCEAIMLDSLPQEIEPIVYLIDDWFTNRKLGMLYEARVGKGKLLVCGADLQNDLARRPAAAQFKQSLLEYITSEQFNPSAYLNLDEILKQQ